MSIGGAEVNGLSLVGRLLPAAGDQRGDHHQSQQQCKNSFHSETLLSGGGNAASVPFDGRVRRFVVFPVYLSWGRGAFHPSGKFSSTHRRTWSMNTCVEWDRAFLSLTQMPMSRWNGLGSTQEARG